MSVFQQFLSLRSNVLIVVVGAFAIMFLIKLTSLLPEKYYFTFSSISGGASSGPFLVDPPGVTGKKYCEILKRNNIDVGKLGQQEVNCSRKGSPYEYKFTKEQEDLIYSVAFRTDADARAKLRNTVKAIKITPLSEQQLKGILDYSANLQDALGRLKQAYGWQFQSQLKELFGNGMAGAYAGLPDEVKQDVLRAKDTGSARLSDLDKQRLLAAHQAFLAGYSGERVAKEMAPAIQKSQIDNIVKYASSKKGVVQDIGGIYVDTYKDALENEIERVFVAQGISPNVKDDGSEQIKSVVSTEIFKAGLHNYVIAILVRVLPVLLFGFIAGLIFGRSEIFSIALAGAFAAFLLSWPVILLWDTVVQSSWASQKNLFLIFYALYVISFFFTARVGAMFGAVLRPALPGFAKLETPKDPTSDMLAVISWKDLAVNILTGVFANAAVYAWNVIIPLTS